MSVVQYFAAGVGPDTLQDDDQTLNEKTIYCEHNVVGGPVYILLNGVLWYFQNNVDGNGNGPVFNQNNYDANLFDENGGR